MQSDRSRPRRASAADIVVTGLFAGLVFATSLLSWNIPTPLDNTRLHMGNVLCLLSGLILGPLRGGLSAGLGSMLFDLTNPLYLPSAPFTLVFKFLMAFLCGLISGARRGRPSPARDMAGAVTGALVYVLLYLSKSGGEAVWVRMVAPGAAWVDVAAKAPVSLINAAMAVAISVPLALSLRRALRDVPLYRGITGR